MKNMSIGIVILSIYVTKYNISLKKLRKLKKRVVVLKLLTINIIFTYLYFKKENKLILF
jgi:hypothetical protein